MTTRYLGLTYSDVNDFINITGNTDLILIGSESGQIPTAKADKVMAQWEAYTLSQVPAKYLDMFFQVCGEILTEYATAGERSLQTGLFPITSLLLFKNYDACVVTQEPANGELPLSTLPPLRSGAYRSYLSRSRADALAADDYDYDPATGAITLTEDLAAGDRVYADYTHTALSKIETLRLIALHFIGGFLLQNYPKLPGSGKGEALINQAYSDIQGMQGVGSRRRMSVFEFDLLNLVPELETRNASGLLEITPTGGLI